MELLTPYEEMIKMKQVIWYGHVNHQEDQNEGKPMEELDQWHKQCTVRVRTSIGSVVGLTSDIMKLITMQKTQT